MLYVILNVFVTVVKNLIKTTVLCKKSKGEKKEEIRNRY